MRGRLGGGLSSGTLSPDYNTFANEPICSYGGADQWQLEGVQPGGIRSGGVYGLWTHCDHDENGPVGPFCYFPQELCTIGDVDDLANI